VSETEALIREAVSRAVTETLKSMFGTKAQPFDPSSPLTQYIKPEVQALVGFEGSHQGMMVVRLPEGTACALAGAFVGEEYHEINEEVRDCSMEIVNILIGQLKQTLQESTENSELNFQINFSLPKILVGFSANGTPDPEITYVRVDFETAVGLLTVQTDFRQAH
jgi:CheY-specific phosphatase CheX